jgi:hypothetical protein
VRRGQLIAACPTIADSYRHYRTIQGQSCFVSGDPGRIRTCDLQLRRLLLYPLSYGAVTLKTKRIQPILRIIREVLAAMAMEFAPAKAETR